MKSSTADTRDKMIEKLRRDELFKTISFFKLNVLNKETFCASVIKLKCLLTQGSPGYKERICMQQSLYLWKRFSLVNDKIDSLVSGRRVNQNEILTKLLKPKKVDLYVLIENISSLVNSVHKFINKLPEIKSFQSYLLIFNIYKSDLEKFCDDLYGFEEQVTNCLKEISELVAKYKMPTSQNINIKCEPKSMIIQSKNTHQVVENTEEKISTAEKLDGGHAIDITNHNANLEICATIENAFAQDEQAIYQTFRKARSGKDSNMLNSGMNSKIENLECNKFIEDQVTWLQSYINPEKSKQRRDRFTSSLLANSWEVEHATKLADSSSGTVYNVKFRDQDAVFKTFEGIFDEKVQKELFNEIQTMTNIRSVFVPQFLAIIWDDIYKGYIMEDMQQGSLYSILSNEYFAPEYQKFVAITVARGLRNLHCQIEFHGNLSSHNVLFNDFGEVKIADFSCAKIRAASLTTIKEKRQPIESYEWTAPEVIIDPTLRSKASDIFSLGVVLWEIFSGKHPFAKEPRTLNNCIKVLREISMNARRESLDGIFFKIANIIELCWSQSPDDRSSLDEVISLLDGYRPEFENYQHETLIHNLQTQANLQNPQAKCDLALQYLSGEIIEKNSKKAFELFLESANAGIDLSMVHLVKMYVKGEGTDVNKMEAKNWYDKLSKQQMFVEKCPTIFHELKSILSDNQGVFLNNPSAFYTRRKRADAVGRGMVNNNEPNYQGVITNNI